MSESVAPRAPLTSKERLEAALQPVNSNMGYEDYLFWGNLDKADLKGLVLDIGSGDLDRFSREAALEGITVVSIDPFLITEKQRYRVIFGENLEFLQFSWMPESPPWTGRSIAGLAQELPVRSSSIDTIVSSAAMPGYIDPADYPDALSEVRRVLVPGGRAYLFPLVELPTKEAPYNSQAFTAALDQSGLCYSFKRIDPATSGFEQAYEVAILEKP